MAEPKVNLVLQLIDKVSGNAEGVKGAFDRVGKAVSSVGAQIAAFATSVALGAFFKSAVEEAMKAEAALSRLGHSVRNAGEDFDKWRPQIDETIKRLTKLTTYTDDDLVGALDTLVLKTGDVKGSLQNLGLVTDLAAAKHIDLGEAATQVAKAINGGDRLFKEFGVTVGTTQEKVEQLTGILAGRASTDAETFEGRVKNLSKAWSEFKEDTGRAIIENEAVGESLRSVTAMLDAMAPRVASAVASVMSNIVSFVGGIQVMAADVARFFMRLPVEFNLLIGYLVAGTGKLLETAAKIPIVGAKFKDVAASVSASGKQMVDRQMQALADIETGYQESIAEITGMVAGGEKAHTTIVKGALGERGMAAKEGHAASEAAQKAHAEKMGKIVQTMAAELLESVKTSYKEAANSVEGSSLEMQGAMLELGDVIDVAIDAKLWEAGQTAETTAEKMDKLGGGIQDGAKYFLQFADAVGGVSPKLTSVIAGIGALGGSLKEIAGGNVIGGIAGAIVSLGGIVGSLFGSSPAELARRELLKKNSDRLKELQGEMHALNLSTPGGQLANVQGMNVSQINRGGSPNTSTIAGGHLSGYLRSRGMTLDQFKAVAKGLGFDLGDGGADWKFNAKDVQDVFDASRLNGANNPFGSDFAGKQSASAAERQARGTDTTANQRTDLIEDLAASNAGQFSDYLGSFDLSTPAGRALARSAIGDLIAQASSGQLSPAFFGDLSQADGLGVLSDFVGMIDAFDSAPGAPAGIGAAPVGTPSAISPAAESFAGATSGPSGVALSSDSALGYLSSIAATSAVTADNTTDLLAVISGPLLSATERIAAGVAGDALVNRIDRALYDASQNSGLNSGAV